ncbi:MAG: 1-acyl-sn-glycerol-3-phosphate acyltransferase [Chloracidobacterium sp.]|nr:1-acyl-sn-glycerol-3-phosphate acyltransferase [Chloracidobacterium sp.]MDW8218459.1 lysophospholipid acyltransferase family protein [Acidobacteriota bacterium]
MSKHRLPDSPMRVVPHTPPGGLNGQEPTAAAKKPRPKDDIKPPEKYTSLLKAGAGVGIALGIATVGSLLLFRLLNRLKVEGLENIPDSHENVLYCPNHSSLLDNFALGVGLYIPRMLFRPEYMPINLADRKNFFGDPSSRRFKDRVLRVLGEYFFKNLRTFPVDRRGVGLEQVDQWVEMLRHNIVIVFPEGTRSRTGEIGRGRAGVGKLIYDARPTVIPVRLIGTDEVLGVGKLIPSIFRTVRIIIGKPLDLSDLLNQPLPEDERARHDLYRAISSRVVDAIRALGNGKPLPMDSSRQTDEASESKSNDAAQQSAEQQSADTLKQI